MDRNNKNFRAGSREVILVLCFALASAVTEAADVEASGATDTSLDRAANGIRVINIAKPNPRGLSHNAYNRFNVNQSGLILNNANQKVVKTQLAGQILGNPKLVESARVILNEVTSTHPSSLRGFTEVAGQRADIVIANPNGISINGAGFINSSRVTLTTGRPDIDTLGNLRGFDVRNGSIAIEGAGLNSRFQDVTSIYTHFLKLNAKLHAKDLDIALGENQIDYPGRKIIRRSNNAGRGRVVLDSSALGGMYANKITLEGTSKGLGMNLPPEVMASSGDIRISNEGRIVLQDLYAGRNLEVQSTHGIESNKAVYAAKGVKLQVGQDLVVKSGTVAAAGEILVNAVAVENNGNLVAGLDETGTSNDRGNLTLETGSILNRGRISATNRLEIATGEITSDGEIVSHGASVVKADMVANQGRIVSDRSLDLTASELTNAGDMSSNHKIDIEVETFNNSGEVFAHSMLDLDADHLLNDGQILGANSLNITSGSLINRADIVSSDSLDVTARNISNDGILSANGLNITSNSLINRADIVSNASLDVTAENISNDGILSANSLNITSNSLINHADIVSNASLDETARNISNDGILGANGLNITSNSLTNRADIASNTSLDVTAGHISNDGILSANSLNITSNSLINRSDIASNTSLDVTAGDISNDGILSANSLNITSTSLINRSDIVSSDSLHVSANQISNSGILSAAEDLLMRTDTLNNHATIFSGGDIRLYVSGLLHNHPDAAIFSINHTVMAASESGARTHRIVNDLGLIQSLHGDIDIAAQHFDNLGKATILYVMAYRNLGNGVFVDHPEEAMTLDLAYNSGYTKRNSNARRRWVNEVLDRLLRDAPLLYEANADDIITEHSARFDIVSAELIDLSITNPAFLASGRNLNLQVDHFVNLNSVTAASRDINFDINGSYSNQATSRSETVTDYQYYTWADHRRNSFDEDRYTSIGNSGYIPIERTKSVSANSVTQAGRSISANIAGNLVNSGVRTGTYQSPTGIDSQPIPMPEISIPDDRYALFVRSPEPDSRYLIETNPRFTELNNFIGSSYLLDRLDFSDRETLKRLGDAFYESKLVREGVFAQSGRRYLNADIDSDNEQFQYLMDNALVAQRRLQLAPGVALTKNQVNRLNRDIVWLEPRQVAGQLVLTPIVYLANGARPEVRGGQIIAGEDTRLQVAAMSNMGLIESAGNLNINAEQTITNKGELIANGTLDLEAREDIENLSGRIQANRINLISSGGSITNERHSTDYSHASGQLSFATSLVDQAGSIEAIESLSLEAKDSIAIKGSVLSGGDIRLDASSVAIETIATTENYRSGGQQDFVSETQARHFASTVSGDNIVILASGARVSGSKLEASNNLEIVAGDIQLDAVNDTQFHSKLDSIERILGEAQSARTIMRSDHRGSELTGATIVLITEQGDIELTGAVLNASQEIKLASAGNINIATGHDEYFAEFQTQKSGWFSGANLYAEENHLEGHEGTIAVSSRLDAANLNLAASGNIELTGANIIVDEQFVAGAGSISISGAISHEKHYTRHSEIKAGYDEIASNLGNFDSLIQSEDGKLSLALMSADYSDARSDDRRETVESSIIQAGAIELSALGTDHGNILLQAVDLTAKNNVELNASGNVVIKDLHHWSSEKTTSGTGTATLNLKLQNEYDQLARSLRAVKTGEEKLKQARKDYSRYQQELSDLEREFQQRNREFEDGKGYLTRADIDRFARRLKRLRDDEEFFKSNIILAAANLGTATTQLLKQGGKAAASSATYGFNASLGIDIDVLEQEGDKVQRESRPSTLSAANINVNAGSEASIEGSQLQATEAIAITATDIRIAAGQSESSDLATKQQVNTGYSWDLLAGVSSADASDLGGTLATDAMRSENEATAYQNSSLQAANIRLGASADTSIEGADISAADRLDIVTGNLTVASVQDTNYESTTSRGAMAASAQGSVQNSRNFRETLQIQTTRLVGQQVSIAVDNHTDLKAAVIAATGKDGRDNGRLVFSTQTLNAQSMDSGIEANAEMQGVGAGEVSSFDYQDNESYEVQRSLATLGQGNIDIRDTHGSNVRFLNTDIVNTEVPLYEIESVRGLNAELDTRLLSADGRREIAEDWLKTGMIANTIELIATTERVGVEDFFHETERYHKTYEAVKSLIAADEQLAMMLQDSGLNTFQKQQMLDQLTGSIMSHLGYQDHANVMVSGNPTISDGPDFLGYYSDQTGKVYLNDSSIDDNRTLIATAGHEAVHGMDRQSPDSATHHEAADTEEYANNYGENLADYTDFSLEFHGYDGLGSSPNRAPHHDTLLQSNTNEFNRLDLNQGDFRLSQEQQADKTSEIASCVSSICRALVETKYTAISAAQGVAETVGAADGAVTQLIADWRELIVVIDELIEDPAKAERVATEALFVINRTNEVLDGDQLSDSEKQLFVRAVNEVASGVTDTLADAEHLDGSSLDDAYGEGKKYGAYFASIIPLSRLSKYLKSVTGEARTLGASRDKELPRFDIDSEAGISSYDRNSISIDYNQISDWTGLDPVVVENIKLLPKGDRPNPREYIDKNAVVSHLARFEDGAVRFTSTKSLQDYGSAGGSEAFVIPRKYFDNLVAQTNGKLNIIERKLGLNTGYLSKKDTKIVYIRPEHIDNLKIPSGNERGVNASWVPGGYTSGGIPEAVLDLTQTPFTEIEIR